MGHEPNGRLNPGYGVHGPRVGHSWATDRLRTTKACSRRVSSSLKALGIRWLRGQDLNLRPLGYEPNELPDCSTSRLSLAVAQHASADAWQSGRAAIHLPPVGRRRHHHQRRVVHAACAGGSAATARFRRARARRIPCAGRGGRSRSSKISSTRPGRPRPPPAGWRCAGSSGTGAWGGWPTGCGAARHGSGSAARDPGRCWAAHARPVRSGDPAAGFAPVASSGLFAPLIRSPPTSSCRPGGSSAGRRILPIRGHLRMARADRPPARARTT